jgi:hypothetical protein
MLTAILPGSKPAIQPESFTGEKEGRVYAIAFDMDIESLRQAYGEPYNNAYT